VGGGTLFYHVYILFLGRFPFNGLTGQTQILFSVSMERLVYVSQISSENGPHSNII
jgi:hypothetical protein